jgi:sulfatase modifying factor 1
LTKETVMKNIILSALIILLLTGSYEVVMASDLKHNVYGAGTREAGSLYAGGSTPKYLTGDQYSKAEELIKEININRVEPVRPNKSETESSGTYTDPTTGMEFVFVKGGCYQMGDTFGDGEDYEKPVHEVCVDDFYMGKYEVTQGQWKAIMGNNPSYFKDCGDNCPVEQVSWNDTQEYIQKLNQRSSKTYRLPTEAEWEYAAREGGRKVRFGTGTDRISSDIANFDATSKQFNSDVGIYRGKTISVGSFKPNGLGLFDMSGNVWEWVEDWYGSDYYTNSPRDNPKGPGSGEYRVLRGGSWDDVPWSIRAANRIRVVPAKRYRISGFRVAYSAR